MSQFPQGLGLDLANAFTGDVEVSGDSSYWPSLTPPPLPQRERHNLFAELRVADAHGGGLLGDEAGGRHARQGVDL